VADLVDELVAGLRVRPEGDAWTGDAPRWFGPRLFGGFLLGQAALAASSAGSGSLRSIHASFLRPAETGPPLEHRIERLHEGRSFTVTRVETTQGATQVLEMQCAFSSETPPRGPRLEEPPPPPEDAQREPDTGPWAVIRIGPSPAASENSWRSTSRAWMKVDGALPDEPAVHASLVAAMTDMTGWGGNPVGIERGQLRDLVSLDHAAWFRGAPRADEWLFYDVRALGRPDGLGLIRASMYGPDGHLVAEVAQELLIRR
jgi:acyl-CoA thioesterase II